MTIPIPTIDDFDTSTVMTTLREVVDYLIEMIPQINKGDITDLQTSYTNNILTITLVKGDGTTISKNVTIQGGSGTETPYPTDVALSLPGTTLNFNMTMSNGSPITGSVDLSPILSDYATDAEVTEIQSDLQEQITGIALTKNITQDSTNVIKITDSINGTSTELKLDISYVSPNLFLTASNEDGTVQAHSHVELPLESDVEIVNGLTIEEFYNKLVGYTVVTEYILGNQPKFPNDAFTSIANYSFGGKNVKTIKLLKELMVICVLYNNNTQKRYINYKIYGKDSTCFIIDGSKYGSFDTITVGPSNIAIFLGVEDSFYTADTNIIGESGTAYFASNLSELMSETGSGVIISLMYRFKE